MYYWLGVWNTSPKSCPPVACICLPRRSILLGAFVQMGVMLWHMALHTHPIEGYPRAYVEADVCARNGELLGPAGYPEGFLPLVARMVARDPTARPSLHAARHEFNALFDDRARAGVRLPSPHTHTVCVSVWANCVALVRSHVCVSVAADPRSYVNVE